MASSRVWSPSRTADHIKCPVFAKVRREVEPIADWAPNLLLGTALGAGLTAYYRGMRDGSLDPDAIEEVSLTTLRSGYPEEGSEVWALEGLEKMLLRVLEKALEEQVVYTGDTIVLVDEPVGSGGRPDLVVKQRNGKWNVLDFKFSLKVEGQFAARNLAAYETDDQFWQYGWEVQQMYGGEVEWLRVLLMTGVPKAMVWPHRWQVTPQKMAFWLEGAEQAWEDMEAIEEGTRPRAPRWQSCQGGRYGRCPYFGWCHEPETRALFYRELPQRISSSLE